MSHQSIHNHVTTTQYIVCSRLVPASASAPPSREPHADAGPHCSPPAPVRVQQSAVSITLLPALPWQVEETHTRGRDNTEHQHQLLHRVEGMSGVRARLQTDEYEVRHYSPTRWVSTDAEAYFMGVGAAMAFRRLFQYITGANDRGEDSAGERHQPQ
ncbi:hypothetical protein INR49_016186 [Caranx melampygus]|nr:hypothetical protein INR49_016186 [Caranx melampygus]